MEILIKVVDDHSPSVKVRVMRRDLDGLDCESAIEVLGIYFVRYGHSRSFYDKVISELRKGMDDDSFWCIVHKYFELV